MTLSFPYLPPLYFQGLLKWRKFSVNEQLLLAGVGSINEVTGVMKSVDREKIISGLIRSEKVAKAKGKGVWQGSEHVTIWHRIRNYFRRK